MEHVLNELNVNVVPPIAADAVLSVDHNAGASSNSKNKGQSKKASKKRNIEEIDDDGQGAGKKDKREGKRMGHTMTQKGKTQRENDAYFGNHDKLNEHSLFRYVSVAMITADIDCVLALQSTINRYRLISKYAPIAADAGEKLLLGTRVVRVWFVKVPKFLEFYRAFSIRLYANGKGGILCMLYIDYTLIIHWIYITYTLTLIIYIQYREKYSRPVHCH